ncbi:MAG: anti-sigma factor family protein [Solirubrobacteraceae bacterium]
MSFARDHQWAPDRMSDYLDGELATGEQGRMEHHLGECHECRRLLAGLRAVVDRLHRLPALAGGVDAVQIAASVRVRLTEPPAH